MAEFDWAKAGSGFMSGLGPGASLAGQTQGLSMLLPLLTGVMGGFLPGDEVRENNPKNWNPYTAGQVSALQGAEPNVANWLKSSLAQSQGAFGNASGFLNQMVNTQDTSRYDPNRGSREFLSMTPEYQQSLARAYQQDRSGAQINNEDMRRQLLREAQGSLDSSGINLSSGAGLSALGSAAIKPLADYQMMTAGNYQQALAQQLAQLASSRDQAAVQDYAAQQQAYQNRIAQLMNAVQGNMSLGGAYQNEAGMANQQQTALRQLLTSLAAPQIMTNEQSISNPQGDAFNAAMSMLPGAATAIGTGIKDFQFGNTSGTSPYAMNAQNGVNVTPVADGDVGVGQFSPVALPTSRAALPNYGQVSSPNSNQAAFEQFLNWQRGQQYAPMNTGYNPNLLRY